MKRTAALRVTGEICLYFSILSLFPAFQRWQLHMAGFTLACLIVGLVAVGLRQTPLRLLLSLLPGICFCFAELRPLLIFPALAWLYFIVYLGIGRFGMDLNDYRRAYRWMLLIGAFFVTINAVNSTLFNGKALSLDSLAYLALFMLLGMIALRSMQMGAPMDRRWHAANVLTVASTLLLAVAVSLALYQLFSHSKPVISLLFAPLGQFILWLINLLRGKGEPLPELPSTSPRPENTEAIIQESFKIVEGQDTGAEELLPSAISRLPDQALTIGAYLVLTFFLLVAIWLIVRLARRGKVYAEREKEYEPTETFTPERRQRRARSAVSHDPAQSVRQIYREYLDYLRENGLRRTRSDTSEEILTESERISGGSAQEEETLRRIYLKARYSAAAVTDDDVAAARRSLDAIRGREKP